MIRRIKKAEEDIIDVLSGHTGLIKSVRYWTTNPDNFIEPHIEYGKKMAFCRLCTQDMMNLEDGQLHCKIELESSDPQFCDEKYNTIQEEGLDIWLC